MSDLNNLIDPELAQIRELVSQGKHAEALPMIDKALRRNPIEPTALRSLAICAVASGQPQVEASLLDELSPAAGEDATFLAYRAQALGNVGRFDEAMPLFERAVKLMPNNHHVAVAYGMALLRQGDFARGWEMYDHRESMPEVAQFSKQVNRPRYTGGNLNGKTILLLGEQGIGDTIMFSRYAPLLAKRGGRVNVAAHAEIADLVRTIPGVERVTRFGEQGPAFNTYARLLSLPRVFDTTLWNVPHEVPYMKAPWGRVEQWKQRLSGDGAQKKIGLVWAGSARHTNDRMRSMHLEDFAALSNIPGVNFYALQKGDRQEEAQHPPGNFPLTNLAPETKDLTDLAALLATLDLLITVDTAPAHLAGALGRPVWVLLPFASDWRWMLKRADSPWYPTMKLFRQRGPRDWSVPLKEVEGELRGLTRRVSV